MNKKIGMALGVCAFGIFMAVKASALAEETNFLNSQTAGVESLFLKGVKSADGGAGNILHAQTAGVEKLFEERADSGIKTAAAGAQSGENGPEEDAEQKKWGYDHLGIAHVENHLNIRKEPNEQAELNGKMPKDAACEILSSENGWAHIKSGRVEGYVSTDYLYTGEEALTRGREVATVMATVNTQTLFVREKPTTDSIVLTMVAQQEELEVTELLEGWAKIMLDDDEAYVSTDYVDIREKLGTAVSMKELMYGQGVSNTRVDLVQFAKKYVGNPYVWGGVSLTRGADCSGFVLSVFKQFGVSLPHSSRAQAGYGRKVTLSEAQPGDLIFYAKNGAINHVAIYIGNGQVVHASNPRSGIKISNATYRTPAVIRRVLP